MKQFLFVFVGGGMGSILRYAISRSFNSFNFPYGTLSVNLVGSFIIGLVMGYLLKDNSVSSNLALFMATGFCGGFTTYSAFSFENMNMLKNGQYGTMSIYLLSTIIIGILAVFAGVWVSKQL